MFSSAPQDASTPRSRFAQAVLAHRFRLVALLCTLSLPLILTLTWFGTAQWQARQIEALRTQTQKRIDIETELMDQALSTAFVQLQGIPEMLSNEKESRDVLRDPSPQNLNTLNTELKNVARYLHTATIWVLDRNGLCIAASNANQPDSLVGIDYSDRDYYRSTKAGLPGRQFAIGRSTNEPNFYFSAPIKLDGQVVGTVASRINSAKLLRWIKTSNSFLTDSNGLVVLSTDPKLLFKAMPASRILRMPIQDQDKQYKRHHFDTLPLAPLNDPHLPGALGWGPHAAPLLLTQRTQTSFTIHTIGWLSDYPVLQTQRWALFGGLSIGVTAIIWAAVATLIYSQHARLQSLQLDRSNRTLARLNAELWEQANHDFLTGLYNRRHFKERLDSECADLARDPGMLTLAMVDLDHFKDINDSLGHDVGDEVLAEVARLLLDNTREHDIVGRLGGEEFGVLMPRTTIEDGLAVAERLRELLAAHPRLSSAGPVMVTLSAGLSFYHQGDHAHQLMRRADAALYTAKRTGRNRVVLYDPNKPTPPPEDSAPLADLTISPPATPP